MYEVAPVMGIVHQLHPLAHATIMEYRPVIGWA